MDGLQQQTASASFLSARNRNNETKLKFSMEDSRLGFAHSIQTYLRSMIIHNLHISSKVIVEYVNNKAAVEGLTGVLMSAESLPDHINSH